MRSSDYWRGRALQVEDVLHNKGAEYYRHLEEQYRLAARKTQQEVTVLYSRLAKNNGISMAEARKLLTTRELKEFRWTVDEYIAYGRVNAISGQWMKELENASLRYRISRLEAMRVQMQHHAEVVFAHEVDGMTRMLSDLYTEGYYRTAHMVQTGLGVGHSFALLDDKRIEKVIGKPWAPDGKNFSERVWGNHRPQLVNDLHTGLTQAITRGEAPDKLIADISKKYDVAASKAGNLVMTESAYFGNAAQQDCYAELDVDEQQFCATLDTKTSKVCQSMDRKIIKSSDIVIGENAPPLHCRCRSVMTPYFEDNEHERWARDAEGNSIKVPSDMTYEEWHDKYIKGTPAEKKKRKKSKDKKPALKDKVDEIKVDLDQKKTSVKKKTAEVKTKEKELKDTELDIQNLENDRITLKDNEARYRALENADLDGQIENARVEVENVQKKVDDLDEQYVRWYERPERGTPEYDAWREWKSDKDIGEIFDNLIDEKDMLRGATVRLKVLENDKAFMTGIDIDDLTAQIAKVDDDILKKRNTAAMLTDDVAHLTDDIADTRKAMELDYQRAGREFMNELQDADLIGGDDLKKLQEETEACAEAYKKEVDPRKKNDILQKWRKNYDEMVDLQKRATSHNTQQVRDIVSQVRSVGASDVDNLRKVHLGSSRSPVMQSVMDAYALYPTDWVDSSVAMSKLALKKTSRGYYSHSSSLIAISGDHEADMLRTAIHELGHRFERAVDDLKDIEELFYNRRTKGDRLKWLGKGHSRNEKSRFDKFLHKYMGKDYGGTAYEIVSMGFEYGYTDPLKLMEDEDMAELIYGLLLLK